MPAIMPQPIEKSTRNAIILQKTTITCTVPPIGKIFVQLQSNPHEVVRAQTIENMPLAGSPTLLPSGAQVFEELFGGGLGIQDVGGGKPGSAKLGDAVAHLGQFFGGVGVRVDGDLAAMLPGEA